MTVAQQLAARALAPVTRDDAERLRVVTLTNVAAGLGELGRAELLLERLPLDTARPGDAAFQHGMRLHGRTQDDFHPGGRVHVGAVTLAATLALAPRAGNRLLDCLAAGYETMCAVASVYSPEAQRRGLRPTGVFGPIGAAAAAGVALGLDRHGIANAIGLAAARSGGTTQPWLSGTDEWLLEIGTAARAGVEAALFTIAGAVAAPEAFEGRAGWMRAFFGDEDATRLAAAVARAGSYISEVAVKPFPVSGIAQVPTELSRRAHGDINGGQIRCVGVRLSELEAAYPGSRNRGPFRSRSDALMSVAFCVACALTDGVVRLARLDAPNELAEFSQSITIDVDNTLDVNQAVLTLDLDGEPREYAGEGASILFPSWETVVREADIVAARSEARPALVQRAVEALAQERPDARVVADVLGERS